MIEKLKLQMKRKDGGHKGRRNVTFDVVHTEIAKKKAREKRNAARLKRLAAREKPVPV